MSPTEHPAKTPSPRTGIFATLRALLRRAKGSGAPAHKGLAFVATALSLCAAAFALAPSAALAAGDANEASCPPETEASPGFRAYLPDCRAYELVTPVFKDGAVLNLAAVSSDGLSVLGVSTGVSIAGSKSGSGPGGPYYMLARTASGWTTSAISPPASLFPRQLLFTASPDLEKTLWGLRTWSQSIFAEELYVREQDGTMTRIGPLVPPGAASGEPGRDYQGFTGAIKYAGASDELSHVLFDIEGDGPLWPGDTTYNGGTNRSLYEYSGTGQPEPELVGVEREGRLISSCETSLGSAGGSDVYNAISADGAAVFFTAVGYDAGPGVCPTRVKAPEVNELYARLDRVESVSISEPSAQACAICQTPATESLGRRPAEFAGASEDGSRVFFLTEQELLPGAKGMNLYEYDFNNPESNRGTGRIVRVSTGSTEPKVQGVARVSEDGSHVYFVAEDILTKGANAEGREPVKGEDNLYVFERDAMYPSGHFAFIASLCSGREESGSVLVGVKQCPSSKGDSRDWTAFAAPVQTTPTGRFLVFQSVGDLTGDESEQPQIFEYDAASEELVRVSVGRPGYEAEANTHASSIPTQSYAGAVAPTQAANSLAVSEDGSTVVFFSAGALTEEAAGASAAGAESVYAYRSAGAVGNGHLYLISDGANTQGAGLDGLDESGEDVFFGTAESLVPHDTDTQRDTYDARIGGGFPTPAEVLTCEDEMGCRPPISAAPAQTTAATPSFSGPESSPETPAALSCPKGKDRSHGRCIKKHHKTHKRRQAGVHKRTGRNHGGRK